MVPHPHGSEGEENRRVAHHRAHHPYGIEHADSHKDGYEGRLVERNLGHLRMPNLLILSLKHDRIESMEFLTMMYLPNLEELKICKRCLKQAATRSTGPTP